MEIKIAWLCIIVLWIFMHTSTGQAPIKQANKPSRLAQFMSLILPKRCERESIKSYTALQKMLEQPAVQMNPVVISKVLTTLQCAETMHTHHDQILTVIDYSLPSNQKRLWVFDLKANKMLFHTYVSHGIASGALFTNQFSNKHNSKASSLGIYKTEQAYYGRHGLSLRLNGLEAGFNDYARGRAVVMHSAWYVNEAFIQKYGRPGRSWGCPAISNEMKEPVINTIKDNGLLVVYYPGEQWITHSKYLNCMHLSTLPQDELVDATLKTPTETRADVLFIEKQNNQKHEANEPVMVMSADHYIDTFHKKAPLSRMIRRQINDIEYIALSDTELEQIAKNNQPEAFQNLFFVVPDVKYLNGRYWKTDMKFVDFGKISRVDIQPDSKQYTVYFDKGTSKALKLTHQFIRWVGL